VTETAEAPAPPVRTRRLLAASTAVAVLVVDQASKAWARTLDDPVGVVGSLQFRLAHNSGAAFSLFEGLGGVIGVLAVAIVAVLLVMLRSVVQPPAALAVGAVLGGAVGNLVDRVTQPGEGFLGGHVTDFIDLQWWPIFNVADIGITVGGAVLVWFSIRPGRPA